MNYWLIPTLVLGFVLFRLGMTAGRRVSGVSLYFALGCGLLAAIPGIVFALYYFKVLGEPIWLYEFRALPGSELAAAAAGFLAGLFQARFSKWEGFHKRAGNRLFAILLFFGLLGPYLKPMLRPPYWDQFHDHWAGDVCPQTSESSCGPACAATLLRQIGRTVTEEQIAHESFTSRHGTENWCLARTLRRHGAQVQFVTQPNPDQPWPWPAIAGVRMENTGHFITILGRQGDQYIIGDPLGGRHVQSQAAWRQAYQFTGFFLVVKQ
jgi:hypothetical protein